MKKTIALLCIIVVLCSGCKYFKKSNTKSVETISADTMVTEQSMDTSAYYGDIENLPASDEPVQAVQSAQYSNATQGKYYMIVGCFTVTANADRYAEKMRGLGYESLIIPGNNNFQMVAARSYNSYRESVNELDKFRNEVTPNAWVYRQR